MDWFIKSTIKTTLFQIFLFPNSVKTFIQLNYNPVEYYANWQTGKAWYVVRELDLYKLIPHWKFTF